MSDAVDLLEETLQEEETALNKLKAVASEFDVTEDIDEGVEDEKATTSSRR
jgi:hypothetical protein